MRRCLLLLLVFVPFTLALVSCDKTHLFGGSLTLEEAIEKSKKDWDQFEIVWAWKDPVPANTQMRIFLGGGKEYEISPGFEAWLIVADTNPYVNGGPHYRWFFVSINNGELQTLNTTSGPYEDLPLEDYCSKVIYIKKKLPYSSIQTKTVSSGFTTRALNSSTKDWAVIINGGVDKYNNAIRYWNDCSWIYRTLRQQYGYQKDHISGV